MSKGFISGLQEGIDRCFDGEISMKLFLDTNDQSYDNDWKDFEDGVQYFSAKRSGADYLVTRNTKDFKENSLKVLNIDEACELLK